MDLSLLSSQSLALGGLVGFIIALSGAGGGVLAVPLLIFGLHLSIQQAAPVGLIAAGAASALGALLGLRDGLVRYRAALLIGLLGMACAPLGVQLARRLPAAPLMMAFAAVLALVSWRMFRQSRQLSDATVRVPLPCVLNPEDGRLRWTLPCARALAFTGVLSGTLSGLLGVGGGFVIVPALTRYTDVSPRGVVATSMAVVALVSVGGVGAAAIGSHIEWPVAAPFAAGAVLALLAGRRVAGRVSGARLQQAFAATAAVVSALMAARALGALGG